MAKSTTKRARPAGPPASQTPPPEPEKERSIWERLRDPFPPVDLEWRVLRSGLTNNKPWIIAVPYVTARAIMDRLDAVLGPENWEVTYREWQLGTPGVLATLRVRPPGGTEWVVKEDGAEQPREKAKDPDALLVAVKGGFSAALKRAAVLVGVGRYLYSVPELFAPIGEGLPFRATIKPKAKQGEAAPQPVRVNWGPPQLPEFALPGGIWEDETAERTKNRATRPVESGSVGRASTTSTTVTKADITEAREKWLAEYHRLLDDPLFDDDERERGADWLKDEPPTMEQLRAACASMQKTLSRRKEAALRKATKEGKGSGSPKASAPAPVSPSAPKTTSTATDENVPVSELATKAQKQVLANIMRSHVWLPGEKQDIELKLGNPRLTRDDLSRLVAEATAESQRRKRYEKEQEAKAKKK